MRFPISANLHPISYHFEVIADYWFNFGRKTATLQRGKNNILQQ